MLLRAIPRNRWRNMSRVSGFLTACVFVVASHNCFAQEVRASLSGVVSDPTGAPVPGAKITVTNVARNTSVTTDTNESGNYLLPFLDPGAYSLTAERSGFKRYQQQNIVLQTLDRARIDVQLEVGALSESVTVNAAVSAL